MTSRALRTAGVLFVPVFLLFHLPYLAPTLEDMDSVNFALGIHEFDPAKHQPHPPGYPIFMALAKLSYAVLRDDARALAVWGALFGATAGGVLLWMFWNLERLDGRHTEDRGALRALCAATVAIFSPLFWFTASRPMSDVTGLTVALVSQALLIAAFARQQKTLEPGTRWSAAASGRLIVLGALVAGLALGFRAQSGWLTLPLLIVVILDRVGRGAAGAMLGASMTFGIGVLAWAIPLVIASGGWSRYVAALGAQAGEDIGGVDLLVSAPTMRHLAADLNHTFIRPWASLPLATLVLTLAAVGSAALAMRNRRALLLILAASGPYLGFHLLFQETVTVRYALPLVPALAYLAVCGLDAISGQITRAGAIAIAVLSIGMTLPALRTYAREGSPTSRAVAAMREVASRDSGRTPGALAMHYAFVRPLRLDAPERIQLIESTPKREWLGLVRYWRDGNLAPVWFLADPVRTDLALVDPASRKLLRRFTWSISTDRFLGGIRPNEAEWLTIARPGWYLEEGWALTPETAGVATSSKRSIDERPIAGYIRRRATPATLMYGGRNLGAAGDAAVRFTVRIDGRMVDEALVKPAPGFFLRMLTLPTRSLQGAGDVATLEIGAAAVDGSPGAVRAAVEQFDVQSDGSVVFGFDTGWHELEYSPSLRRLFRWSAKEAVVRIHHAGRDVTLRVTGESPLRYFDSAPTVTVRAGARELARFSPHDDFYQTIPVPADALAASDGQITIGTDRTFVPADRSGSMDRRVLGLRIYSLTVE